MIAIEFEHRLAEHQRAQRLFYARRSLFARADKIVAVLAAAFGVLTVTTDGLQWWSVMWLVAAPLIWFNRLTTAPLVVRYVFRRTAKFHERTALTFSDEQIRYKTPSIDSTLDWSLFTDLVEDDQLFLLRYKAPRTYAIIPKRAFASPAAIAEFRDLVGRKLARRAA